MYQAAISDRVGKKARWINRESHESDSPEGSGAHFLIYSIMLRLYPSCSRVGRLKTEDGYYLMAATLPICGQLCHYDQGKGYKGRKT